MPDSLPMQSNPSEMAYVVIDQEVDKIIASLLIIEEKLKEVDQDTISRKLKDLFDNGVSPYVAEAANVLNQMEEVE